MNTISLSQIAEQIGGKLWVKGDVERIYVNAGYNTKKMSTKTFIYKTKDGQFNVNCTIKCDSQPQQWIASQEDEVIESVNSQVERAIWVIENEGADYDNYLAEKELPKNSNNKVNSEKYALSSISIDNIEEFLSSHCSRELIRANKTLWHINHAYYQLATKSKYLSEKDEFPPHIHYHMFERTFIKYEKSSIEKWSEEIGEICVGNERVYFNDIVEFSFLRRQGKNGPNKKNVFAPVSIPDHVMSKLKEILEVKISERKALLKSEVESNRASLLLLIEKYKSENGC